MKPPPATTEVDAIKASPNGQFRNLPIKRSSASGVSMCSVGEKRRVVVHCDNEVTLC